jgi:glutamate/tyrosine decarboxylase-like PLP-dependent enzyme
MFINEFRSDFATVESEIAAGPIVPSMTQEEIRSHLSSRYDFERPMVLEEVIADVEQMLRKWQVQVTHPRYFGLFNPSVTLASVVAETLVAMYNPQLANWRTSPAGNEIERHTLGWLAARFGLPADTSATFTSGGSEANLSAVVVALTRAFSEYGENGLRHLIAVPTIYVTDETHHSFNKIAHLTGLGRRALRKVATTSDLKLDIEDLRRCVAEDRKNGFAPFMVVGVAGTTAAGVIDPLSEIGNFCREENLWFHVDAAWGGAAVISKSLRHYLAGIETADSITCDAHKWFSVPMGAGMFFCRHPDTVAEAFRADVSYMPKKTDGSAQDPYTTSVQWSRRFIGLKLFLTLAQNGESGHVQMIEHQTRMGQLLRELLIGSGWRVINTTPLPVVCFTRDELDITEFLSILRERQIVWMSEARLSGTHVLRACITSFRTTEADIHDVVDAMNLLLHRGANHTGQNQETVAPAQPIYG